MAFVLSAERIDARVGLHSFAVLQMITLLNKRAELPAMTYNTWLDVYTLAYLTFVVISLVATMVVYYVNREWNRALEAREVGMAKRNEDGTELAPAGLGGGAAAGADRSSGLGDLLGVRRTRWEGFKKWFGMQPWVPYARSPAVVVDCYAW